MLRNHITCALPTYSLAIGAVGGSVLFVLSAPGDSKVSPGLSTWAPGYICGSSDQVPVLGEAAGSAVRGVGRGKSVQPSYPMLAEFGDIK